jgi:hypothetical protein
MAAALIPLSNGLDERSARSDASDRSSSQKLSGKICLALWARVGDAEGEKKCASTWMDAFEDDIGN